MAYDLILKNVRTNWARGTDGWVPPAPRTLAPIPAPPVKQLVMKGEPIRRKRHRRRLHPVVVGHFAKQIFTKAVLSGRMSPRESRFLLGAARRRNPQARRAVKLLTQLF